MLTLLLILTGLARATPNFPDAVATWADLPCSPPCALCHASGGGARTPFALALKDRGLVPGDETSLYDALDQLDADGVDSDNDGMTDADELRAGIDPNPGDLVLCEIPTPMYGCFDQGRASGSLGGLLLAIAALRRSHRRATGRAAEEAA